MEEERFAPGGGAASSRRTDPWWGVHASRYAFADRELGADIRLLDVACGSGYGLATLAHGGTRNLVGVDVDAVALRVAQGAGAPVVAAGGESLPFRTASFDAVTSFETLEHMEEREAFVSELARVLRPGGRLVLSTPNARYTRPGPDGPSNRFHVHEYEPEDLRALIEQHFSSVVMLGQTLSRRFRVSPFHDDQLRRPPGLRSRLPLLAWKVTNRLPVGPREALARLALRRQHFYPVETDYDFTVAEMPAAPVLVVTACRP